MCLGVKELNSMSLCIFSADQVTGCTCDAADWLGGDKGKLQLQVNAFSRLAVLGKTEGFFFPFGFSLQFGSRFFASLPLLLELIGDCGEFFFPLSKSKNRF